MSVGARTAETAKSLARVNGLPSQPPPAAVTFVTEEFRFHPVFSLEMRRFVQSFPSNKAPGPDKVSMRAIKDALPCILSILTEIVKRSLLTPVFPLSWKEAVVIPLLKEGDHEVANKRSPCAPSTSIFQTM